MSEDCLTCHRSVLRGADSNTLLRMYDEARGLAAGAPSQRRRSQAGRAAERIARELARRNVRP